MEISAIEFIQMWIITLACMSGFINFLYSIVYV